MTISAENGRAAASESGGLAGQLASLRLSRDEVASPRRFLTIAIVVGVVVVVAAVAYFLFGDQLQAKSVVLTPVINLQPGQEPPLFVATGTVAAPVTASVAPRVPARLLKLSVAEGDRVTAGQVLAQLDPTDLKLAVSQARADLGASQARVQQAEAVAHAAKVHRDRAAKLAGSGAGTQSALEDAELDIENAAAQLEVAKGDLGLASARLNTAEVNLKDATLLAPFDGVVLRTLAEPGDWVATGPGLGVLQLADMSTVEVDGEVAEAHLGKLRVGMPVEVRLDAMPTRGLAGTVFSVRPNVDPAKATAIAKVRLAETGPSGAAGAPGSVDKPGAEANKAVSPWVALYPGMNGRVNFLAQAVDPAALNTPPKLEVAASALTHTASGPAVLTVGKNGRLDSVHVVVGGSDGDRVVLKEGPPAGAMVVQNPEGLSPGRLVKPQQ
jgi:RND family efflux transporter MFP subunit